MSQTTPPTIDAAPTAPQRGDRTTFSTRVDAFVTWLVAAVAQFAAVATNVYNNAVDCYNNATSAATSATTATTKAAEAAASAASAQNADSSGTSTTSLAIGTGSKVFTTQSGKSWVAGQVVLAYYDASNSMVGTVTSYSGTSLTISVASTGVTGSGTYAVWTLSLDSGVTSVDGQRGAVVTLNPVVVSADRTAVSGEYLYPTTAIAITLPATPATSDTVRIFVAAGVGVPWVAPNGSPINRIPGSNFYIDVPGLWTFTYFDSTRGWLASN